MISDISSNIKLGTWTTGPQGRPQCPGYIEPEARLILTQGARGGGGPPTGRWAMPQVWAAGAGTRRLNSREIDGEDGG